MRSSGKGLSKAMKLMAIGRPANTPAWLSAPLWVLLPSLLVLFSASSAIASPPSNAIRFLHDAEGKLKAAIDPEGDTAVYGWDAAGNLLSISRHPSNELSIVQLSPQRGEVGSSVRIEGTGFSTTPSSNTVKFNGTTATVSAASATALTVKVPAGATTGSVTVATPAEGPVPSASFTVVEPAGPQISSISPSVAIAGEEVTISGSNFEASALSNVVTVNQARPEVTSSSSSAIKIKVPPATLGGRVEVSSPGGGSCRTRPVHSSQWHGGLKSGDYRSLLPWHATNGCLCRHRKSRTHAVRRVGGPAGIAPVL